MLSIYIYTLINYLFCINRAIFKVFDNIDSIVILYRLVNTYS